MIAILVLVRNVPTPGDIFNALSAHPGAYTLSLGHFEDLTLSSFAYLRLPLALAGIAFLVGAIGTFRAVGNRAFLSAALMMVLFVQAARVALVVFDPFLSSRPLAEAILRSPDGQIILDRHYYAFSSVAFYTNRPALLLNGRVLNLSYGSYAPGAPDVFIDDPQLKNLWQTSTRYYLVASESAMPRLEKLIGREKLIVVAESGGKFVLTNIPLPEPDVPSAGISGPGNFAKMHPRNRPRRGSGNTSRQPVFILIRLSQPSQALQIYAKPGIFVEGQLGLSRIILTVVALKPNKT